MIRVAVVDDHPIARHGIEQMLADAGHFEVVASVATAAELAGSADVVIMDLYHDGELPCLTAVADLAAVTRVLVISASGQASDVVGAIQAGASGYVTKHAETQMFVAAVRTVAAGGFAMSSQLADILQAGFSVAPKAESPGPVLSAREEETLGLIARGLTHSQVATRMGVTKATVDTYVERIRAKLQVGNKAELTRAAMQRSGRLGDRT
jgi:two-component system, NarL family, nitrate/nitrite response regulator NarL